MWAFASKLVTLAELVRLGMALVVTSVITVDDSDEVTSEGDGA